MKKVLRYSAWTLLAIILIALGTWFLAYQVSMGRYEKQWSVHEAGFPIPFPLSENEIDDLRLDAIAAGADANNPQAGMNLETIALERAIDNGKRLMESRTTCHGCHAADLGGATIIDVPVVGRWVAPNLTAGAGSVTVGYTANDWDRAVRHAVRRDGRTSSMPSQEYLNLADHELSDIVAYIQSRPPVNRDLGTVKFGPVFAFMIATDSNVLSTYSIDHDKVHAVEPPAEAPSVELGEHIVQVCRGCHGPTLSGGKLAGDPNMPIVANLTPHETGLKSWTEADFVRSLREGVRKDGTAISEMMPWKAYARMSDTEIKAMWAYLQTVPPLAKGKH